MYNLSMHADVFASPPTQSNPSGLLPGIDGHLAHPGYLWTTVNDQFCENSLSVPAGSWLEYPVPVGARQFVCHFGVDDACTAEAKASGVVRVGRVILAATTSLTRGKSAYISASMPEDADVLRLETTGTSGAHVVWMEPSFLSEVDEPIPSPTGITYAASPTGMWKSAKICVATLLPGDDSALESAQAEAFLQEYEGMSRLILTFNDMPLDKDSKDVCWVKCGCDEPASREEKKMLRFLLPRLCSSDVFLFHPPGEKRPDLFELLSTASGFRTRPAFFADVCDAPSVDWEPLIRPEAPIPKIDPSSFVATRRSLLALEASLRGIMPLGAVWAREGHERGLHDDLVRLALADIGGAFPLEAS